MGSCAVQIRRPPYTDTSLYWAWIWVPPGQKKNSARGHANKPRGTKLPLTIRQRPILWVRTEAHLQKQSSLSIETCLNRRISTENYQCANLHHHMFQPRTRSPPVLAHHSTVALVILKPQHYPSYLPVKKNQTTLLVCQMV